MAEKAKVPRDLADAIVILKNKNEKLWDIIFNAQSGTHLADKEVDGAIYEVTLFATSDLKKSMFIDAFMNGFEIANEQDLVKVEYEEALRKFKYNTARSYTKEERKEAEMYAKGILRTLDILGVKIEGMNK